MPLPSNENLKTLAEAAVRRSAAKMPVGEMSGSPPPSPKPNAFELPGFEVDVDIEEAGVKPIESICNGMINLDSWLNVMFSSIENQHYSIWNSSNKKSGANFIPIKMTNMLKHINIDKLNLNEYKRHIFVYTRCLKNGENSMLKFMIFIRGHILQYSIKNPSKECTLHDFSENLTNDYKIKQYSELNGDAAINDLLIYANKYYISAIYKLEDASEGGSRKTRKTRKSRKLRKSKKVKKSRKI